MTFFGKLLDKFKLKSTREQEYYNDIHIPKYCTDLNWTQDSNQSITTNGKYDLNIFSRHEANTIYHVLNVVKEKYPIEYQSIGLANESSAIKYKARYVLFEIVILLYEHSKKPIDQFAVAVAYQSKGAHFRKIAIKYFEESIIYLEPEILHDFLFFPL